MNQFLTTVNIMNHMPNKIKETPFLLTVNNINKYYLPTICYMHINIKSQLAILTKMYSFKSVKSKRIPNNP